MKNSKNNIKQNNNLRALNSFKSTVFRTICFLIITIGLSSCNSSDDDDIPTNKELVVGKWEVTSGNFLMQNAKFLYINKDNTIDNLNQDQLGFKEYWQSLIIVTENQIELTGGGSILINYTVQDDKLTLQPVSGGEVTLIRAITPPETDAWIKTLNILEEGDAPWDDGVDIAFDGVHLLGWNRDDSKIMKVNPVTMAVEGSIPTTLTAYAVEVEKSDSRFRQFFQSSTLSKFDSYVYLFNEKYYESIELGRGINGIASIEPEHLWVGSQQEKKLFKYKSNGAFSPGQILQTIPLEIYPYGLDYQNGFLYIASSNYIYKCQTSPNFKAIESYKLPDNWIQGVAFDGTNFWLSIQSYNDQKYKLVKTDL